METYQGLDKVNIENAVVTVGIFDGVHSGHNAIINRIKAVAKEIGGESVVVSFWPHPRLFLTPEGADLKLLSTIREKKQLLSEKGVDKFIMIPFTREFSNYSSERFIEDIIVGKLKAKNLIVGYNHHFGKDRMGDFNILKEFAAKFMINVEQVNAQVVDGEEVSSTLIRKYLFSGEIMRANQLLGYSYSINGTIIGGKKIGRSIGYPTANILPREKYKLIPRDGVYAVKVCVEDQYYSGMLNIGIRPTLDNGENGKSIEVHIFDFEHQIYGKLVQVQFIKRIRDEKKFSTVEELVEQLKKDESAVRKTLSSGSQTS
jgi:riboflavin kinase/FMN adenylyltransferase